MGRLGRLDISIQLLLLFNNSKSRSHVGRYLISIQLLLLFNILKEILLNRFLIFQYNSCYYSTINMTQKGTFVNWFQYNSCYYSTFSLHPLALNPIMILAASLMFIFSIGSPFSACPVIVFRQYYINVLCLICQYFFVPYFNIFSSLSSFSATANFIKLLILEYPAFSMRFFVPASKRQFTRSNCSSYL